MQYRGVIATLTIFEILSAPNPAANSVRNNYLSSSTSSLLFLSVLYRPTRRPFQREGERDDIYAI
jgi:hypothetical protein